LVQYKGGGEHIKTIGWLGKHWNVSMILI
jgi:hypothetical protein